MTSNPFARLLQDLRYTIRGLRRDAGLATFAILIVALGIGASTTVFSVVNALLLKPLPLADPERLVWIRNGDGEYKSSRTVQSAYLEHLREESRLLDDVAGFSPFYDPGDYHLTGAGEPERLTGVPVTFNFFTVLGVQPWLGRLFTLDEVQGSPMPRGLMGRSRPAAVVLAHDFWVRRFGSDPSIAGRAITIDNAPVTVIGVLPESFDFASLFAPGTRVDFFLPFPLTPQTSRQGNTLALVGRLHPHATPAAAQTEAATLSARLTGTQRLNRFTPRVITLREQVSGQARPGTLVLASAVALVMLIVCANLSNLLLARSASRSREMAVRAALGAGRGRLIQQLLTESVVLSCAGAAAGLMLAVWGTRILSRLDTTIALLGHVRVDATVLAFTLLSAVITGLAFGVAPALRGTGLDLTSALKQGGGRLGSAGKEQGRLRTVLVIAEVALACVLLIGAGLLLRSFVRVLDVELGFAPERVMALRIDPSARFSSSDARDMHYEDVLRRVRAASGGAGGASAIESAALTDVLPLGFNRLWTVGAKGQTYVQGTQPDAYVRVVSDGYLRAMGVTLLAGRDFAASDRRSSRPVVIINETMARVLWPSRRSDVAGVAGVSGAAGAADAIGRVVVLDEGTEREVIGVVRGTRHLALERESGLEMYLPLTQTHPGIVAQVYLVVRGMAHGAARGGQEATAMMAHLREVLRPIDARLAVNDARVLQDVVDKSISPRRFLATLVGAFAAFALLLASLGIYGVISYSMTQRRQEIAIRMALGATAARVRWSVLGRTLALACAGASIGVVTAWPLGRAMQGLLFEVTPADPATFAAIPLMLVGVAAFASYWPVRRAMRVEVIRALRGD